MPKYEVETQSKERVVLALINPDAESDDYVEEELRALVDSAGLDTAAVFRQRRRSPDVSTFIGKGKVEELAGHIAEIQPDALIVDGELNAVQAKNLEDALDVKIIDRTQLILDIFAQRAHTREAALQVELAQLKYLLPRLMGKGTALSRLGGGIGTRGPGETKLESDRRRIRARIARLEEDIQEAAHQRDRQRKSRRELPFPLGAIVGYTNAGKSTLLNALTKADIYADDRLFATLQPTTRKVALPGGWSALLSDTVGFLDNLPHTLIEAFKSTLQEAAEADFLVHVIDASNPNWELQRDAVMETLEELGARDAPTITVFNKADKVKDSFALRQLVAEQENSVALSARTGLGLSDLLDHVLSTVDAMLVDVQTRLAYSESSLVDECYAYGYVKKADYDEAGIALTARVLPEMAERLKRASQHSAP